MRKNFLFYFQIFLFDNNICFSVHSTVHLSTTIRSHGYVKTCNHLQKCFVHFRSCFFNLSFVRAGILQFQFHLTFALAIDTHIISQDHFTKTGYIQRPDVSERTVDFKLGCSRCWKFSIQNLTIGGGLCEVRLVG